MLEEYKAPESNIEIGPEKQGIETLPRFSAWAVAGLTIITLGIYPIYWLYVRTQSVNEICEDEIPQWLILSSIIAYLVAFASNFIPEAYRLEPKIIISMAVVSIANMFLYLWWIVALRNRLQKLVDLRQFPDFKFGPVLTFFFQTLYLQYKINQYIDNSDA